MLCVLWLVNIPHVWITGNFGNFHFLAIAVFKMSDDNFKSFLCGSFIKELIPNVFWCLHA